MSGSSVLDYARSHRLSEPITASDLSKYIYSIQPTHLNESILSTFQFPSKEDLMTKSKLQLSNNAATCLADMVKQPEPVALEQVLDDQFRRQKLQMETAMLYSDHDKDMKWFKRPMNLKRLLRDFAETCDTDTHELQGLEDPLFGEGIHLAEAYLDKIRYPRLDSSEAALRMLLQSTDDQRAAVDLQEVYESTMKDRKV